MFSDGPILVSAVSVHNPLDLDFIIPLGERMDRLDALAAFSAIAELGSFAGAARQLGVSPQAVTRAIAGLESRLGVLLLRRSTRAVRLTEAGELYLQRCRRALDELAQGERLLQGGDVEPQGLISVTAPVVFGRLYVAPVLTMLLKQHPRLRVRLLLMDRFVNLVEEGIDVALRIGDLSDSALRARRLGETRQVLVASPDYLRRRGSPDSVGELLAHDLIAFEGVSRTTEWRFGADGKQVLTPSPRLRVNSADAAIDSAIAGLGITRVLSYQAVAAIDEGKLRRVLPVSEPPSIPVQLIFSAALAGSANVQAFLDAMSRTMAGRRI